MTNRIVIAGAGHAGGRCALLLRQKGFEGCITLIGDEPFPPYERPPLSKGLITGESNFESCLLATGPHYIEQNINLVLEDIVVRVDRENQNVVCESGDEYGYDKLILATGGECRQLECAGTELDNIFMLRNYDHSVEITSTLTTGVKVLVIGGGFIGLEIASSAVKKGCNVRVVEYADFLLSRVFPEKIARDIEQIHKSNGVSFVFGDGVDSFSGNGHVAFASLASGVRISADVVIVGIGIVPRTVLAVEAGLEVENGIKANQFCQTSDENIYAIGDSARGFNQRYQEPIRLESWQNAEQQADIVADHICGSSQPWESVPWFWSDQYQYNIQMAGIFGQCDNIIKRGGLDQDIDRAKVMYFGMRNTRMVGAVAIGEGTSAARDLRVSQKIIEQSSELSEADMENLANPDFKIKQLLNVLISN